MPLVTHIRDLKFDPRNPRKHTPRNIGMIEESLRRFGPMRGIVIDEDNCVLAGNGVLEAAAQAGIERVRVVEPGEISLPEPDGEPAIVAIRRTGLTDEEKAQYKIADNLTTDLSGWDSHIVRSIIEEDREGTTWLFNDDDFRRFIDDEEAEREDDLRREALDESLDLKGRLPSPRTLPLDAVYTMRPADPSCLLAYDAGFKIGTRSTVLMGMAEDVIARWSWRFPLTFIDNDYHDYDHQKHLDVIARHRPKYATVRDIMSRRQCDEAGIPYYDMDQILRWAEDLAQYAERVIVIPKIDVLDDIPAPYVLGYSVPTSYGGTPIPASRFAGRDVHLLGGSWKMQLGYLSLLGDDVVSLDFNYINHIARWGKVVGVDGEDAGYLHEMGLKVTNARQVSLAISLGHIGRALFEFGAGDEYRPQEVDEEVTIADDDLADHEAAVPMGATQE